MHGDRRDLTEGFLFTDQYQLTMAQLYWKYGLHERTAQFDYFFRRYPDYGEHQAGYAVFAGLGWLCCCCFLSGVIARQPGGNTLKPESVIRPLKARHKRPVGRGKEKQIDDLFRTS